MGVIDNSYKGEEDQWMMPVYATEDVTISKDDRICQFRITEKMPELGITEKMPELEFEEVEHLHQESRGGFGSTGVN